MRRLIKRGSVKDVLDAGGGRLAFAFSDRYSVFDWGAMPDELPGKGRALADMCALLYRELGPADGWARWLAGRGGPSSPLEEGLAREGLPTHFVAGPSPSGEPARGLPSAGDSVLVERCLVPDVPFAGGRYDYGFYRGRPTGALVPLEVVFRLGVPSGSSLPGRLRGGDGSYLAELGLASVPAEGERFERPLVEFSTKLESSDRYLPAAEAARIAGMGGGEVRALRELAGVLARRLADVFGGVGAELWDGKLEFAFAEGPAGPGGDRAFKLVDSIGPDELRLLMGGVHLSKELLRSFYRGTEWEACVKRAKRLARERGTDDWRRICGEELGSAPPPLSPTFRGWGGALYPALADALAERLSGGRGAFPDAPPLADLVRDVARRRTAVVVGGGGREHALAWKLARSPLVSRVVVVPGNPGMALTPKVEVLPEGPGGLAGTVAGLSPDLAVVGPEGLLADGLADELSSLGVPVVGPSREAARLESSKAFMKGVLSELGLPTARFAVASSVDEARDLIRGWAFGEGIVVKSDALAGGKGVFVCGSKGEALEAARGILGGALGAGSGKVVLEERLEGGELSSLYLCDGRRAFHLASARDYKRALDGDRGPNTGGMGCVVDPGGPDPRARAEIDRMAQAVVDGMARRGTPYRGVLFVGSMLCGDGPRILELNARFGDPEAQAVLPALENDLFDMLVNVFVKGLGPGEEVRLRGAVHVVAASEGYPPGPGRPVRTGRPISFADPSLLGGGGGGGGGGGAVLFTAGVRGNGRGLVSAGGRVLGVTAVADDAGEARRRCYEALGTVGFEGMRYRKDIALGPGGGPGDPAR